MQLSLWNEFCFKVYKSLFPKSKEKIAKSAAWSMCPRKTGTLGG